MNFTRTSTLVLAVASLVAAQPSPAPDIDAQINAIFPTNPASVSIFGQSVPVGVPVSADLDVIGGAGSTAGPTIDPMPTRGLCPGYNAWRNLGGTVISRVSLASDSSRKYGILVNAEPSTGAWPGSAGFVQITDPRFVIKSVEFLNTDNVPPSGSATVPGQGMGFKVDRANGRVEWCLRGGCPACGCVEVAVDFMIIVEPRPTTFALADLVPTGSLYPGNDVLTMDGTLAVGSDASMTGNYAVDVSVSAAGAPVFSVSAPFSLTAGTTLSFPSIPLLDTSTYATNTVFTVYYTLRNTDTNRTLDTGVQALRRLGGPPASCP